MLSSSNRLGFNEELDLWIFLVHGILDKNLHLVGGFCFKVLDGLVGLNTILNSLEESSETIVMSDGKTGTTFGMTCVGVLQALLSGAVFLR